MKETIEAVGIVLKTSAVGESGRRVVILTEKLGKITAFAHGAKKPGNALMAVCQPFVSGVFMLSAGRDAYTLKSARVSDYFTVISQDMESACYGSYFLELADYYTREGLEAGEEVKLLYLSLKALTKSSIPHTLVQLVFELRMLAINGEYTEEPPKDASEAVRYAWEFIITTPLEHLYTFVLSADAEKELRENVEDLKGRFIDRRFHSLDVLSTIQNGVV